METELLGNVVGGDDDGCTSAPAQERGALGQVLFNGGLALGPGGDEQNDAALGRLGG
jgi:hypothetical protein